ncbi:MFS general substrate transporter [Lactarius quietus]|nr:MFS general substrate transporter [Lactarius quietus]
MSLPTLEANPISEVILPETHKDEKASVLVTPATPQSYQHEPVVTRREMWSYYLYSFGNNGLGPQIYSLTLFQGLATAAGYDPVRGPGSSCLIPGASGKCVLPWGSGTKSVSSIVLIANGVSFAIMTLFYATLGPVADYRMIGRWLLIISTTICWAAQFASMSLTSPSRWGAAMALYIISFASRGLTQSFYGAPFPHLARNTPHTRELNKRHERGELSSKAYEMEKVIEKNKISSVSMFCLFLGDIVALSLNLSLLLPLNHNPKVDNYVIILTTGYWVLFGIWWFIFQQPRPGPKLPRGDSYLTIGLKQSFVALKECRKLPYTFAYILSIFIISDGLGTNVILVSICQNEQFKFSFLQNTYLYLVQVFTCAASVIASCYIQRHWKIDIKKMYVTTSFISTLIPVWGMIGLWTNKFGLDLTYSFLFSTSVNLFILCRFHNAWEFWAYNVVAGLVTGPAYSFTQTLMSELTPPGFEYMFFGLLGLFSRSASIIGPNVIQVIIDKKGNNWKAFPVLFAIGAIGCLLLCFGVNVPKGRQAAAQWAAEKRGTSAGTMFVDEKDRGSSESKSEARSDGIL